MNPGINCRSLLLAALLSGTAIFPGISSATIVEFQTVMGNFEVNLYDNDTPATVAAASVSSACLRCCSAIDSAGPDRLLAFDS